MRAVIQRVSQASVEVEGAITGAIGPGLLVLIGIEQHDTDADAAYIAEKVVTLRCFMDDESKFNRSVLDIGGAVLAIPQFTLHGDCRKGRRPSFSDAARPEVAAPLYERVVACIRGRGVPCETGVFGAHMQVRLLNDGPVTLLLDSKRVF